MPSFSQRVVDNQIIIFVDVSRGSEEPAIQFRGLLDTGAQLTAVSPKVVQNLSLVPIRATTLTVASGASITTHQYRARVDIPIDYNQSYPSESGRFLMGKQLSVARLPYQPEDYDVLLGMDLIGTFHMTIYQNWIILSN